MSKIFSAVLRNDFAITNYQYCAVMVSVSVVAVLGLSALGDLIDLTYSIVSAELDPFVSTASAETGGTPQ